MCKCKKENVYPSWGLVSWLWHQSPALLPWCRCGPIEVGGGQPGQQPLWPCRLVAAWQPPAIHLHSDGHKETIVTWSTAFADEQPSTFMAITLGHISVPFMIRFRATWILPVTSSSLADAIQAGGWWGLVSLTDFRRSRAFLMSLHNQKNKFDE